MSTIRRIDATSVRRICSGQVVVDLATAIKELVENALDAGATGIDVRLVEHGAAEIEVSDNGSGIPLDGFEDVVLRYATSKLRDFEGLRDVSSFGFRGEALSSLCELSSEFEIATRDASSDVGARLRYARDGTLASRAACARALGTTVSARNIFEPLPVRRAELERNVKKHYARALRLLHAYALGALHCRIRVTLCVGPKRSCALAVQAGRKLGDAVGAVFGPKFAQTLEPFDAELQDGEKSWRVKGLISRVGDGVGRTEADRQFVFVNGRPIEWPRLSRGVNEVWRTFEMKHKPAFVLDVTVDRDDVDVNVAPDKREVVIDGESALVSALKAKLQDLWEPFRGRFRADDLLRPANATQRPLTQQTLSDTFSSAASDDFSSARRPSLVYRDDDVDGDDRGGDAEPAAALASSTIVTAGLGGAIDLSQFAAHASRAARPSDGTASSHGAACTIDEASGIIDEAGGTADEADKGDKADEVDEVDEADAPQAARPSAPEAVARLSVRDSPCDDARRRSSGGAAQRGPSEGSEEAPPDARRRCGGGGDDRRGSAAPAGPGHVALLSDDEDARRQSRGSRGDGDDSPLAKRSRSEAASSGRAVSEATEPLESDGETHPRRPQAGPLRSQQQSDARLVSLSVPPAAAPGAPPQQPHAAAACIDLSLADEGAASEPSDDDENDFGASPPPRAWKLDVGAVFPEPRPADASTPAAARATAAPVLQATLEQDDASARAALSRSLSKSDFPLLEVLGQFNLGFIVCRLGASLYIVDQHAIDEKYRYEKFWRESKISTQPLIAPLSLDLCAAAELCVIDRAAAYEANGFRFEIDADARAGDRVKLVGVPAVKGAKFGPSDVRELTTLLEDDPEAAEFPKLPKLHDVYASKACRSAVMIGTHLSKPEMERLLRQMAHLDQPWNCPHGRPTMRYLARAPDSAPSQGAGDDGGGPAASQRPPSPGRGAPAGGRSSGGRSASASPSAAPSPVEPRAKRPRRAAAEAADAKVARTTHDEDEWSE
ncbi:hypothetical protein M885DRAFT_530745 [Pelagophyceae sp. CCMP2097]|nr:hypothetical protein M885DRAFT_530745 [Pelagophyceae sp. CCMP2097]